MLPRPQLARMDLLLSVLLGGWFLYSGGEKVFGTGLTQFTRDVANYRMVTAPWDAMVAYTLPWFEMVAGVCLMLGYLKKGALITILAMVVVFSIAVGHAWWTGLNIACGCRGDATPMNYWVKTAEFAGYFAVIGFIWFVDRGLAGNSKR